MVYFFDDIDSQVETFYSLFLDVLDQHAPIKRIKIKSRSNPFVTPETKQLMKTRDRWHRKAIQTNDKLCWNGYSFFRQEVKRELWLAEKIHVRNEIANSRGNTNATWKILNQCMSRGTAKRPSTLEDHETLANKFNKYFTSVGELTAYKANLITREYVWIKNVVLGRKALILAYTLKQKDLSSKMYKKLTSSLSLRV